MMDDKIGVLDSYHLSEALKPSARKLGERCGTAAVIMLANRLAQCLGTPEEDRYSYIWRSAIEEHEQDTHKDSFRTVLVDALRDAALGSTSTSSEEAISSTKALLGSPYQTLVRIGIYVCGEHYGNVGQAFWNYVKPDWLLNLAYWHELFWFIRKGFSKFSAAERSQFITLINQFEGDWQDESRQEEWNETHRRDLLHPAVGLGDSELDAKYKALVDRWGPVQEHPDFQSYTSSGWVGDKSPATPDTLLAMPNDELMALLKNFVPEPRTFDGPTYNGLAAALSTAVRASEDGFANRTALFIELARPYQHGLLRGLKERWADDKHDIDWQETLSLIEAIISDPTFKIDLNAEPSETREPSAHWVAHDIADLMQTAASGGRLISSDLYIKGLENLRSLLALTNTTEASKPKDAVSHALNSTRGRTLQAIINIALALRRQEVTSKDESGHTWSLVGPILETELSSSASGLNADFAALAGMYCSNLHYLNKQWVEANFDRLFSTGSDAAWRCAAQGFSYQRHLYEWLYKKLTNGGHLRKMVFSEEISDQVVEKAIQFAGLAYLEGLEELSSGGLLTELIDSLKAKELSHLCWFFWTLRGNEKSRPIRASRILEFWRKVAETIRLSEKPWPELQSSLGLLAAFIEDLSPPLVEIWADSAPHAQVKHHAYVLIEHLARLARNHPTEVATVFRAALSGFLPEYPKEDVIQCVIQIAESGKPDEAEWICNAYTERESTLLKGTYETIRAKQRAKIGT